MNALKTECKATWTWLHKIPVHTWARHAMDFNCKTDLVVNNSSEVFNKMILDVRGKPIVTMIEGIRTKLMVKFNKNRTKTETTNWEICPTYAEILEETKYNSRWCQTLMAGPNIYQVTSGENTYSVNLLGANIVSMPYKFAVAASNRCHPRCISWCWLLKLVFPPLCLLLPNFVFENWRLYVLSSCPWPQVRTRHRKYDMCKCFFIHFFFEEISHKVLWLQ